MAYFERFIHKIFFNESSSQTNKKIVKIVLIVNIKILVFLSKPKVGSNHLEKILSDIK